MANKTRGRERLLNCDSCGRRIPRDKAVSYNQMVVYSTDLKNADDVRTSLRREFHYCPSCGKHRHIYERKGRDAARRSAMDRANPRFGDRKPLHGQSGGNPRDSWSAYEPGGSKSGHSVPKGSEGGDAGTGNSTSETSENKSE